VLGHPVSGASWEGHVIETLIRAAPSRASPHFYRTAAGSEIDLILDLPGSRRWGIEVKRGLAPALTKGFHNAVEDLEPERLFVIHPGQERYPKGEGIEVIGLRELATELAGTYR
jgi:predicted AAA+ superfamily ATPase